MWRFHPRHAFDWSLLALLGGGGAFACSDRDRTSVDDSGAHAGAESDSTAAGLGTGAPSRAGSNSGGRGGTAGQDAKTSTDPPNDEGGGRDSPGGVGGDGSHQSPEGGSGNASGTGSAGSSAGGTGSAGSSAGGDGALGGSGQQAGGEAGAGGQPALPTGEACVECGAARCASLLDGCEQNPECAPWLDCVASSDSESESSACDSEFSALARVYYAIYACLCASCPGDCSVVDACEKQCVDATPLPPTSTVPDTLVETGLYALGDGAAAPELAPDVYLYESKFPLWADGAGKDRYIYVPRCSVIDTSDMDHWVFPVGTRLWKHFSVDDQLVETRMLHRYGPANTDWLYATYGYAADKPGDPRAAAAVLHGQPNAGGTLHDIPDPSACPACHGKLPDKPLGFGALQLSHSRAGLNMQKLSDWGWLTVPARNGFEVPGTSVQQAALGYLHGNCGGCHNEFGEFPRGNPMKLRLLVGQTNYAQTDTVLTTIGVATLNEEPALHGKPRIASQDPEGSAVYLRMTNRGDYPMPPLATEMPDSDGGVAAVRSWINSLPKP